MPSRLMTDPATRSRPERFHNGVRAGVTGIAHVAEDVAEKIADGSLPKATPAQAFVPDEVIIGGVRIAPATILAPMAGVTDTVFRRFIKHASFEPSLGSNGHSACGLIMTEFTSADGIYRTRESKRKRYLHFVDDEHPISAQLFGSDPFTLSEAAKVCEGYGFDIVDLNLGCPAKKVVKCNGGSGLLRDLPAIQKIFETVRAAVKIPFTVKFRMGWSDDETVCVELAKLAENCGLNAVALHARTREQGYSGNARWEWIAAIKDATKLPVIGNGDIRTPEDACEMVAATKCDAVMIGRMAPSNPWIFKQITQYKASLKATGVGTYHIPTSEERYQMMRTYFKMLVDEEVNYAQGKMKQFASWFTHGVPGGTTLRKSVYQAKNEQEIFDAVDSFFANPQPIPAACAKDDSGLETMQFADCG